MSDLPAPMTLANADAHGMEYIPASRPTMPADPIAAVYELRSDRDDHYHSHGIFATLDDVQKYIASVDGVSGVSGEVGQSGGDGEELEVYQRVLGDVDSCGAGGKLVATIFRDWEVDEELDERCWASEWRMKDD